MDTDIYKTLHEKLNTVHRKSVTVTNDDRKVTVRSTPFAKRTYGASLLLRSFFCS